MPIAKVWIIIPFTVCVFVCLFVCLFVCTVTDFSADDNASGVVQTHLMRVGKQNFENRSIFVKVVTNN